MNLLNRKNINKLAKKYKIHISIRDVASNVNLIDKTTKKDITGHGYFIALETNINLIAFDNKLHLTDDRNL